MGAASRTLAQAMVVLDFLGQGQRCDPPKQSKVSPTPPSGEFATHRAMILENGPSPRHERTFITRLHAISDRGVGNAGPIRFTKDKCGGSNRNGAVFAPRNVATPPEADAEMSARQSERLRAAIAEARSVRAKPPPRYREYQGYHGKALPKAARSTPQPITAALYATTSHIVGTVKQRDDNRLPVLPQAKVVDQDTARLLRAAAFAAFKRDSGAPSSNGQSERTSRAERSERRRKKQQREPEAASVAVSKPAKPAAKASIAPVASSNAAQSKPSRREKVPQPPPDPRFPTPRRADAPRKDKRGENGSPAGVSSWKMSKRHPAVPKDPSGNKPPTEPIAGQPRRSRVQPAQMMSTVDRKAKLAHLAKEIGIANSLA